DFFGEERVQLRRNRFELNLVVAVGHGSRERHCGFRICRGLEHLYRLQADIGVVARQITDGIVERDLVWKVWRGGRGGNGGGGRAWDGGKGSVGQQGTPPNGPGLFSPPPPPPPPPPPAPPPPPPPPPPPRLSCPYRPAA